MSIRVLRRVAARRWIEAAAAASSAGSSFPAANSSANGFFLAASRPAAEKGARPLHTFTNLLQSPTPRYIPALIALVTFASCSANVYLRDKRGPEEASEEAHEAYTDDRIEKPWESDPEEAFRWDKYEEFFEAEYYKREVPDYINWVEAGAVTPAIDQGQTDSCAQCAAVAAVEGIYQIKTGNLVNLSVQQLMDCMGYGCEGGSPCAASFKYVTRAGCIKVQGGGLPFYW